MKKAVIILTFLLINITPTFASNFAAVLGNIETNLYGFQYNNDSESSRLDRIETTIYGNKTNGTTQQRLEKLKKDLNVDLIGQEIKPKEDTFKEDNADYLEEKPPVADANIQYPAVDELELMVFKKQFNKKEISQRLNDLETKTFGKSYSKDDLATRVDRLKAEIKPKSLMSNGIAQSSNEFYNGDVVELDRDYHLDKYESPRFNYDEFNNKNNFPTQKVKISTIENSVLRKTFPNDSMDMRLSRLEENMFGTQFTEDDEQTRLNRLASSYQALKSSSKYDSNKFSRNMTAAMQIGTILLMVLACIL